ncbi:helix-turn-helix domain-containing protein [Tichowtungia aerotolerans]|uniref:Helix-turn-helix domain-containing protein n=1 Tax=Tichowtungia aerotolerans TaxID=2697043 RepID=A0A6P1M1T7_9BACT|nr:AraC family transcriptional regulator [Tichowtungia aerotolerans]QHI68550.1 helix-turn-helix domain-containing protein [Tichowtungia aerotolerans]
MMIKTVNGSRRLAASEEPQVLFVLTGKCRVGGRTVAVPVALPMTEPVELTDVQAMLLEGCLSEAVAPDDLSVQIVRETFFEFEVTNAHRQAAVSYLFQRLETCEPPETGHLAPRVMSWLELHLDEEISLDSLSEQFGCSKSGLAAAFRRDQLRPPMKELALLRIEKVCELLKENELNVSQIARAVGYDDLAAFNHFFRRHTGRSPSDYRESCLWIT